MNHVWQNWFIPNKKMGILSTHSCLIFLSLSLFTFTSHVRSNPVDRSTYIIHMDKSHMPKAFTSHHHWYSSTLDSLLTVKPTGTSNRHLHSPPKLVYTYDNALHGFSAVLSPDELQSVKKSKGFISAYSDRIATLDTTRTPEFLNLNSGYGLWPASNYGKDIVVGVIDSGVWPESPSFNDDGMTKVPTKWKGTCEVGTEFNSSMCNRKLIGARYFNKGVIAADPSVRIIMNSARDTTGHGTHVASIVAGNYVERVSFFGYAKGTARGVAPRARLAVYKVSWLEGPTSASDVIAGIDQAIADGVDVISISLGFDREPLYEDLIAITSFAAMEKGIFVSCSAGNSGSNLGRVNNDMPWVLTVAASTIDRSFSGTLTLGNGLLIVGWTMFPASSLVKNLPLVYNKTLAACDSSALLSEAPDAIIICDDPVSLELFVTTTDQIGYVAASKVPGAIFISNDYERSRSSYFPCPGVVISRNEALDVIKYAQKDEDPRASIQFQQTIVGTKPSPAVASYSSRGPSSLYLVLKPDIMAPGSLVLAASPPNVNNAQIGSNIFLTSNYSMMSGTSMACPHASGVAALLKGAHPEWSVAAIKSAMMTTTTPFDNTLNPIKDGASFLTATPLAMGAGEVDPNRALDPGLIYDTTSQDYVNLLCSKNYTQQQILALTRSKRYSCSNPSPDLNYPSFMVVFTNEGSLVQSFKRTLTNVGEGAATYRANVTAPNGSTVQVSPKTLVFKKKYEKQSYALKIKYKSNEEGAVSFGWLVWVEDNGKHRVRSPIVVSPVVDFFFG